ncbi:hypothetical protein B0H15DRAFT_812821 [Mycena belliarum]|uniref:ditrans,polycis-polyprenyl diphosphate synthase [(2E,6E)-farnesyldiphosphate specific] n=1 Tax=Mycena belliarum TaxID=1033014 RepID=A0AAD6UKY2_9AGAR|nr:hypothetical protein B0H15DRAFT_812821 [Mycena belliae]
MRAFAALTAMLEYFCLRTLHSCSFLIAFLSECWNRFHATPPLPLKVTRRRTPQHLALLLVHDSAQDSTITREYLLGSVSRTVSWCRVVGIPKLTVYDAEGVLAGCAGQIYQRVSAACDLNGYESSESDVEYPPTPPSSDCSDSRPLSPEDLFRQDRTVVKMRFPEVIRKRTGRYGLKKRQQEPEKPEPSSQPLALSIASRHSSKPAIAAAATSLARRRAQMKGFDLQQFSLSVETLNSVLEGPHSLSAPDFLILHHLRPLSRSFLPLELYGFPPWQIRLTEIHHCCTQRPLLDWFGFRREAPENAPQLLTEIDFRTALDEFASAEMRFGK